ncbi:MAG: hypothetical protein AB7Q01_03980 [Gammaproteobacteria bacterium]
MVDSTRGARGKVVPFRYLEPAKRRATQYEEVTLHVQWDPKNYATQGWFNRDCSGRPSWDENSTALKADDWWKYRDPAQEWFRPFVTRQAALGDAIERAIEGARRAGTFAGTTPRWREFLATHYATYRFPEYGLFIALSYAQREALSDVVASPMVFQGLEKDRHAQDIALYCMELESALPGFSDETCKTLWMESPVWQPAREVVELLMASRDWGEIDFVINLVYEPLFSALFSRELVLRFAPRHGDAVTSVIAEGAETDRQFRQEAAAELVRFLRGQNAANAAVLQSWLEQWTPRVMRAVTALAPLFELPEIEVRRFDDALSAVREPWWSVIEDLGLRIPQENAA